MPVQEVQREKSQKERSITGNKYYLICISGILICRYAIDLPAFMVDAFGLNRLHSRFLRFFNNNYAGMLFLLDRLRRLNVAVKF
jgi:hypothetical protein